MFQAKNFVSQNPNPLQFHGSRFEEKSKSKAHQLPQTSEFESQASPGGSFASSRRSSRRAKKISYREKESDDEFDPEGDSSFLALLLFFRLNSPLPSSDFSRRLKETSCFEGAFNVKTETETETETERNRNRNRNRNKNSSLST